jgi:hypothetical protein
MPITNGDGALAEAAPQPFRPDSLSRLARFIGRICMRQEGLDVWAGVLGWPSANLETLPTSIPKIPRLSWRGVAVLRAAVNL